MTAPTAPYTIGRGKPPLHTRFKKGQSGNPSGKPGPAKLAKTRFQQALLAALEAAPEELALSRPATSLAAIARQMALDAVAGRSAARRQVLSQLDAGCDQEDQQTPQRNEADGFSLAQGEYQGGGEQCLEGILWPDGFVEGARALGDSRAERGPEPVSGPCLKDQNEEGPFSLGQGESQGGGKDSSEAPRQVEGYPSPTMAQVSSAAPANLTHKGRGGIRRMAPTKYGTVIDRNGPQPFSLVQGKTQGSGENLIAPVCAARAAERRPAAAQAYTATRARLMMGAAAVHTADACELPSAAGPS